MGLDRRDYCSKQRVARGMTLAVVDLLEFVHVNEREYETSGSVPRAVDLSIERDHSQSAAQRAGERIELRLLQRLFQELAIPGRGRAICRGAFAVHRSAGTFGSCAGTHARGVVPCRLGGRARKAEVAIQRCGGEVALHGGAIARVRPQIPQVRALITRHGIFQTLARGPRPGPGRLNACQRALDAISTRGLVSIAEFQRGVSGALTVGGDLVAVRGPLVGIRVGSIAIRR